MTSATRSPNVAFRQQQLDGALGLRQAMQRRRSGSIDRKDHGCRGPPGEAGDPEILAPDFDPPPTVRRPGRRSGAAVATPQRLPWRRRAQRRDQIEPVPWPQLAARCSGGSTAQRCDAARSTVLPRPDARPRPRRAAAAPTSAAGWPPGRRRERRPRPGDVRRDGNQRPCCRERHRRRPAAARRRRARAIAHAAPGLADRFLQAGSSAAPRSRAGPKPADRRRPRPRR